MGEAVSSYKHKVLKTTFRMIPDSIIERFDMYCLQLFAKLTRCITSMKLENREKYYSVSLNTIRGELGWSNTTLNLAVQALIDANIIDIIMGANQRKPSLVKINWTQIEEYDFNGNMPFVYRKKKSEVEDTTLVPPSREYIAKKKAEKTVKAMTSSGEACYKYEAQVGSMPSIGDIDSVLAERERMIEERLAEDSLPF